MGNKLKALKEEIEHKDRSGTLDDGYVQEKFDEYAKITGDYFKYWEGALSVKSKQEGS